MNSCVALWFVLLVAGVYGGPAVDRQDVQDAAKYRWCVPAELFDDCVRITRAADVSIGCVAGIDRLDCLRKVQHRQADYVAADPEDVYVASHFDNQDFTVFSELRTSEEPTAMFRYEGIMLVRASDNFHSLADLRGKRSCHTGFGRNVGYKIPVTRLLRAGVLKLPVGDVSLSPVERELAGLSELFSASCLPGSYSSDAGIDRLLKGRYANLCERCDQPQRCAKDDRFAGYEGAIRCLVENGGDVAFSKTIYVRKYFGLPVTPGGTAAPALNPNARTEDYAYLCEDGTTRPIGDGLPVCSWAQRPWQVLLGNGDLSGAGLRELQALSQQLRRYWTEPNNQISDADRRTAQKLWIDKNAPIVDRQQTVAPREYLAQANYAEVIEREGRFGNTLRLCVVSEDERQKCDLMRQAAYSRDIRPALQCVLKTVDACVAAVRDGTDADVVVLRQPNGQLKPLLWETYDDVMVAVADKTITKERLHDGPVALDTSNEQAVGAARVLSSKLPSLRTVDISSPDGASAPIRIVRSKTLTAGGPNADKVLVCLDLSFQPLTNAANCHLESTVNAERNAAAIYVRKQVDDALRDSVVHAFTAMSEAFGRGQPKEQVFRMFGPFRLQNGEVKPHLIFHDYASELTVSK
ncbi:transferrin [Anopheles marshallii]|uniref:transferrin n=1 Tax=Anopheles marshallii TaxID=1521116 RepID=UPI00237A43A6|nr:transferrin [Anopheles marshallii]